MTLKATGQPFERKKYGGDPVFFNGRLNMNNQSSRFNRVELDRKTWKYHLGSNYEACIVQSRGRLFIKE